MELRLSEYLFTCGNHTEVYSLKQAVSGLVWMKFFMIHVVKGWKWSM
jgi:hypothetical protein